MQHTEETLLSEVLTCLNSLIDDSFLDNNTVLIPKEKVKISPFINSFNDGFVALGFHVFHSKFDKPFMDISAGVGQTTEIAVENAVKSFLLSAFCGIRHFINDEFHHEYENIFCGNQKKWYVSESCIANMGEEDHTPENGYWDLIKDELFDHLGNKKYYIIKVYTSKQNDGHITCECRINNYVSPSISQKLTEFVESWEVKQSISSNKQFFLLEQSQETYQSYPYSYDQIADFTVKAAKIMTSCDTDEKYDNMLRDIKYAIGEDFSLAVELKTFIPEICAENAFSEIEYDDHMTVMYDDNSSSNPLIGKDQFASYRLIQESLFNAFDNESLSNDDYRDLISMSAIYSVICKFQSESKEKDLSSLRLTSLAMSVDDDYEIR